MHILISTYGTQGDMQPFIALGVGLRASGHTVTVCTCAEYRALVETHGLQYAFMDNIFLRVHYLRKPQLASVFYVASVGLELTMAHWILSRKE